MPHIALWNKHSGVVIKNTIAKNYPNYGAAVLNGLDSLSKAYKNERGDSLISNPIDLSIFSIFVTPAALGRIFSTSEMVI